MDGIEDIFYLMPRKKTIQPPPIKVIETHDLVIEIRDKDTRDIGRGLDKKFDADQLDWQILTGLVDMYLSNDRKQRKLALELLESKRGASKLARKLEEWGYGDLSERALRGHAKRVREHWTALMEAKTSSEG